MPVPDVLISRQNNLPSQLLADFTDTLSQLNVPFQAEETEPKIYNAIEYYIPTALVVFLAKPFFDGFLKKAGEDGYSLFKRSLIAMVEKAALIRVHIFSNSPKKIALTSPFSRVVSIYSHCSDGTRVNFLLPADNTREEYGRVVDSMLKLLAENHAGGAEGHLSQVLSVLPKRFLYVLQFDATSGTWLPIRSGSQIQQPEA